MHHLARIETRARNNQKIEKSRPYRSKSSIDKHRVEAETQYWLNLKNKEAQEYAKSQQQYREQTLGQMPPQTVINPNTRKEIPNPQYKSDPTQSMGLHIRPKPYAGRPVGESQPPSIRYNK